MADQFFTTLNSLQRGLDVAALRSKVISHNIANIDTPGFKASSVPFSNVLTETIQRQTGSTFVGHRSREGHLDIRCENCEKADLAFVDAERVDEGVWMGRKTREGHVDIREGGQESNPVIVKNEDTQHRYDENNVDIEYEMNELARNSLYYNALAQKITSQLGRLRLVIQEGR